MLYSGEQFIDYVFSFYGKGGIYDMGATKEQIREATNVRLENKDTPFDGDSVDRELVRDILIAKFGLVFPQAPLQA